MTMVRRTKRPRHAARRVDLSAMREAMRDQRVWTGLGIVVNGDDGSHFDQGSDDVLVEVELVPSEDLVLARLGAGVGWRIPKLGEEVVVVVPDGEYECGPVIVGRLSTGSIPDGLDAATTVIENGEVQVHDGSGGAVALATKADIDALRTALLAHIHVGVTAGAGVTGVISGTLPSAAGTTVLKGK